MTNDKHVITSISPGIQKNHPNIIIGDTLVAIQGVPIEQFNPFVQEPQAAYKVLIQHQPLASCPVNAPNPSVLQHYEIASQDMCW